MARIKTQRTLIVIELITREGFDPTSEFEERMSDWGALERDRDRDDVILSSCTVSSLVMPKKERKEEGFVDTVIGRIRKMTDETDVEFAARIAVEAAMQEREK